MADTYIMEAETARKIAAAVAAREPADPGFTGSGLADKIGYTPPLCLLPGGTFRDMGKVTIGGGAYFIHEVVEKYQVASGFAVFPHAIKYTCAAAVPDGTAVELLMLPGPETDSPPVMRWSFAFYLHNTGSAALSLVGYNRNRPTGAWNKWNISAAGQSSLLSCVWRYWINFDQAAIRPGLKLEIQGPVTAGTEFYILGAVCNYENPVTMGEIDAVAAALGTNTAAKARAVQPAALQDAPGQDSTECEVNGNGT